MAKKNTFDIDNLFADIANKGLMGVSKAAPAGVVEFAEEYLLNGEEKLYTTQRAWLKSFYNEPLNSDERSVMQRWASENRTTWVEGRRYSSMALEIGRGGSKSTMGSICALYEFYKLISLDNPSKHYNLFTNSPIAIFVIARSMDQVKNTLFGAIKGYAENSQYFKSLADAGIISIQEMSIKCRSKNIAIFPQHTNSPSLVGYNLKLLILDEAARFGYDDTGYSLGDLIWDNVGAGTKRFGNEGRKIAISSAWEPGDFIENLYSLSQRDQRLLGGRFRTWDMNLNPGVCESVLKSDTDYIKNPIKASLEYEGMRFNKQDAYLTSHSIQLAMRGYSVIDARPEVLNISNAEGDTRHYIGVNISRIEHLYKGCSYVHTDYGIKKDSAATAVVRAEIVDGVPSVIVDSILVWKPYIDKDEHNQAISRVVSFIDVEEKLIQICKLRRVSLCSFDTYQSQSTIQRLHMLDIRTKEMGVSNALQLRYYALTKNLLDSGRLILPKDSSWSPTLQQELSQLIQRSNGRIDHPRNGSKDIADAVVNAVFNCVNSNAYILDSKGNPLASSVKVIEGGTLQRNKDKLTGLRKLTNNRSAVNKLRNTNTGM